MADSLRDDLRSALAGRYEIEEEVGRGGMAIVYRARDVKHDRTVAVKVLRPELAASLGAERFLREISIAAKLHHPHILQLYDSGDADGLLYYVMPFVEGESLRDRLQREGPLPLEDAMQVMREAGGALGHAHSYGIVHRDVKPENILLVAGHAVVSDFGIARAVSEAGGDQLTETGLAIGTPLYMSPEQAAGDKTLDARSDVYSLACVYYEMLAGTPPFTGTSAAAIMARHSMDPVPSLRTVRSTVPSGAEGAVMRALAKVPADRWATAHEFVEALQGAGLRQERASRFGWVPKAGWAALLVVLLALAALVGRNVDLSSFGFGSDESDLVAVLPFEVVGPDSVAWLGAAIPEFLSVVMTGDQGTRAVSRRTVLVAWERARNVTTDRAERQRRVARDVGASLVIAGQVIQQPNGVLAQAELIRAETREILAEASATGPAGSEITVAESLGVQLLAASAGEFARLSGVVSSSTEAVKAWLAGQEAYRAGDFPEAVRHYTKAVDADTTFALAAYGLMIADGFALQGGWERGRRLAWQHRDRLPRPDSLLFVAEAYRNGYPRSADVDERMAFAQYELVVQEYPDRWDAWVRLGDVLWHDGGVLFEDAAGRAVDAFETALALDSTGNIEPGLHLGQHYLLVGDLDAYDRHPDRYKDGFGDWLAGVARGDAAVIDSARIGIPEYSYLMLWERLVWLQQMGTGMEVAELLAAELEQRGLGGDDDAAWMAALFYLNAGRPSRATPLLEIGLSGGRHYWRLPVAIYFGADTAVAARVASEVEGLVGDATASEWVTNDSPILTRCYLEHWRMNGGETESAAGAAALLSEVAVLFGPDYEWRREPPRAARCALLLEAWLSVERGERGALAAVQVADSAGALGGVGLFHLLVYNLRLTSLYERLGRDGDAMRMVRRRGQRAQERVLALAVARLAEARIAARLGRREEAIKAYDHYLWLRYDPEPDLAAEAAQVREELAELVGEASGR